MPDNVSARVSTRGQSLNFYQQAISGRKLAAHCGIPEVVAVTGAPFDAGFARLRDQLVAAIDDRLARAADAGLSPDDLGDAEELSARIGAAIPIGRHPIALLVGACFDTPGPTRWLGTMSQAIADRIRARTVLACRTTSGSWRYPTFQFDEHGNTLPHLHELLDLLAGPGDEWRWRAAIWLAAPAPYLPDDGSAASWLAGGGDANLVLTAARGRRSVGRIGSEFASC